MAGGPGGRLTPPEDTFLAMLTDADRELLAKQCQRRSYAEKHRLYERGDKSDGLVVILKGIVKISAPNAGGVEAVLAIRGFGDVVGELSAVGEGRRSASVTALSPVDALLIDMHFFREFVLRPSVHWALITVLAARVREADELRLQLDGRNPVQARLARQLSRLAKYGQQRGNGQVVLEMRLTQRDLASAIGASRSAVAKALSDLRQRGIVTTERQRIDLIRPEALN
jgi:CRP/FNR family cyclic AMP-dependent transcriptional regulator